MITIEQMIQREVLCCMSHMVSALAKSTGNFERADHGDRDAIESLNDLCAQASGLASSVFDYEEAARQARWYKHASGEYRKAARIRKGDDCDALPSEYPQDLAGCAQYENLDPFEWEVYEHWAVSPWFAEQLMAQGERVDTGFASLNVWARTCTGQAISADGVVKKIYAKMMQA